MNTRKYAFILVMTLGFMAAPLVQAAMSAGNSTAKLLYLSGLTRQVNEYPGLIKAGFVDGLQGGAAIPEELATQMVAAIDSTIVPSAIVAAISDSVTAALTDEEIEELLQWYRTDAGREITALEEEASTPQAYQEIMNQAPTLAANTPRVEAAVRLDDIVGSTDMSMAIQKSTGIAVYGAIVQAMAPGTPVDISGFEAHWRANEQQIRAQTQQMVVISYVYTYRTLDDESLAAYEAFVSSPASRKFNEAVTEGLRFGMNEAVAGWAAAIADIVVDMQEVAAPQPGG